MISFKYLTSIVIQLVFVTTLNSMKLTESNNHQKLLLVSLDGFRYDSIEKYNMKNFNNLLRDSSQALYLKPQFSTQTFGNHWTLVTGLDSFYIFSYKISLRDYL